MNRPIRSVGLHPVLIMLTLLLLSCGRPADISDAILNHPGNFYHIDFAAYPAGDSSLPIGIFDSGTGGLATLADIIAHPGLAGESFIYLGDLANMPYGSYPAEENTGLLVEHVMKDVQFLLGNKYYESGRSRRPRTGKSPVKAIVIACNTATAFALDTIREFLHRAGADVGVIGVIEAGVEGAFSSFRPGEKGSIAVMATDATVKSGAYPQAIIERNRQEMTEGAIHIFQQAGIGIAEATDESPDAVDKRARTPREGYRGPSERASGDLRINMQLWDTYDFERDDGALLHEGEAANPSNIQLNSVRNYIKFHVVTLMEKIRATRGAMPLSSVILACTHYPFHEEIFRQEFMRLRELRVEGEYPYRQLIAEDLTLINPSDVVALQLYDHLAAKRLLNGGSTTGNEFFVSVPNLCNRNVRLRDDGSFTYEYKYGRRAGEIQEYVKVVPFSRTTIPEEILERLAEQTPLVYDMMVSFNQHSAKSRFLSVEERIRAR